VQTLLRERRSRKALHSGALQIVPSVGSVLSYTRTTPGEKPLAVAINFAKKPAPWLGLPREYKTVFQSSSEKLRAQNILPGLSGFLVEF